MAAERRHEATATHPEEFSREVLLHVLDAVPLGVAIHVGPAFTYAYANSALQALSGDRELLGRPYAEVWPELADRVIPVMQQVLDTGETISAEDRAFGARKGEPRFVTFSFERVRFDGGDAVLVTADDTTEEVSAREEAQQEASTLNDVLERMGDAFFALDCQWRFVYVNTRAAALLETPREALLGRTLWDAFPAALGTAFDTDLRRAMREQAAVVFQQYYAPLDMWASVQAFPSASGLTVFLSDITSLKQREAALATNESQLRAVIDNSPNVIQMKDLDGVFIRVNDEFARLFGMNKEDIVGKSDRDLLPPGEAHGLEDNDAAVREAGHPLQFEEEVEVPGVGYRRYLTTKFPLKDSTGQIYGTAGISTDITDRAEQERRLAQSEERFRKIFEEGTVGIVLVEPTQLRIVDANDSYARLLGYTGDELRRITLLDVTLPEDRRKTRRLIDLVLKGEIPFYRWEKRYVRKDGAAVWVSVTGSLLHDEAGQPTLFLGMVEDITQRKQAEAALRDRDLAIRKAYSDVISAVTGGKLILLTAEEIRDALGPSVGPTWETSEYDRFSELRHALGTILAEQGLSADDANAYVLAAAEALTNAVKHAGNGQLCVRRSEHALQIEVTDHGPGIDFEYLPKAALVPGFSTQASLGMGFTIMLEVCDRLLLATQPGLTIVVLEKTL